MVKSKPSNPFMHRALFQFFWKEIPVDPKRIYEFKFVDITNPTESKYDNNLAWYIVFDIIPMEDYSNIGFKVGKITSMHFPQKGFTIAVDNCLKKNYDQLYPNKHYTTFVKISRPSKKTIKIHEIKVSNAVDRDIFSVG